MNLKWKLEKTGIIFSARLHLRERDLNAFSSKPFGNIIPICIGFIGFCFEPKNDGSRKKRKQNTKKTVTAMKM